MPSKDSENKTKNSLTSLGSYAYPTGDQEVAGSSPTMSATFFCGD